MTAPSPAFATTHWSVVLTAGDSDPDRARTALSQLCEGYWYPLYAFLRRRGSGAEEARDLTQGFFADLLERGDLGGADPERGRFRSFLLTALKNFAANAHEREAALKRGGGRSRLSLDFEADLRSLALVQLQHVEHTAVQEHDDPRRQCVRQH